MTTKAAIYARVSTEDQDCERQLRDLKEFAAKEGYEIVGVFTETARGMKNDRKERAKVMSLAQGRKINVILVTEMTRWGRSTVDLLSPLQELQARKASVVSQTGLQFDLKTPQGKLMSGLLSLISEFERDVIAERTKSGLVNARARGKTLGRPKGNKTVSKHTTSVLKLREQGMSLRAIAARLSIGKQTVQDVLELAYCETVR